jgi:hypothetical protein
VNDQGSRSPFRRIEDRSLSLDEQENVLEQIVCFRFVSDNSLCNTPHKPGIPAKQ